MSAFAVVRGAFAISDLLREAAERSLGMDFLPPPTNTPHLADRVMRGVITALEVQPGLSASAIDIEYLDNGVFETTVDRSLTCGLLLAGKVQPMDVAGHSTVVHHPNELTIAGFGETSVCRRPYRKRQRQRVYGVTLRPTFFDRFEDSVVDGGLNSLRAHLEPGFHVRSLPYSPTLTTLANEALDAVEGPYTGNLADLFQESLALRFVVEMGRRLDNQMEIISELGRRRYEQVRRAKEVLDASLTAPPKTLDLAREVGTNIASLQTNFRKAYGTTLFGYVRDQRLTMARLLIHDHGLGVAEAGYRVGFSNPSAFTAAYRRKFGKAPTAERQERSADVNGCAHR